MTEKNGVFLCFRVYKVSSNSLTCFLLFTEDLLHRCDFDGNLDLRVDPLTRNKTVIKSQYYDLHLLETSLFVWSSLSFS